MHTHIYSVTVKMGLISFSRISSFWNKTFPFKLLNVLLPLYLQYIAQSFKSKSQNVLFAFWNGSFFKLFPSVTTMWFSYIFISYGTCNWMMLPEKRSGTLTELACLLNWEQGEKEEVEVSGQKPQRRDKRAAVEPLSAKVNACLTQGL